MVIQGRGLVMKYVVTSMILCNMIVASHADVSNSLSYSEFVSPQNSLFRAVFVGFEIS